MHSAARNDTSKDESSDIFRILVATDNHLGFMEKDSDRRDDSFITFEEILIHAKQAQVDFILLGGDLFHDNKPSRRTLHKTIDLIRRYCLGDRPIRFAIVNDRDELGEVLANPEPHANYEDPNINIAFPIFAVHGNHDDPAGEHQLSAMDLLAACNYVNYFGKCKRVDEIVIKPLLLQKGETKIALYGLGNIRDDRLHRTFRQKKVRLVRPPSSQQAAENGSGSQQDDEWFNIMVIHQNRIAHTPTNCIAESMLDEFGFLDLVVWGHEHECRPAPEQTPGGVFITQPGSSIATSLSQSEQQPKHVFILEIKDNKKFRLIPKLLSTVRPFIMDEVVLSEQPALKNAGDDAEAISQFLEKKVEELIKRAQELNSKNLKNSKLDGMDPKVRASLNRRLPLVRLRVEYTGHTTISAMRFGQKFVGKVANPDDILLFYKQRGMVPTGPRRLGTEEEEAEELLTRATRIPEPMDNSDIKELISDFLQRGASKTPLSVFAGDSITSVVYNFVEKQEKAAIQKFVQDSLGAIQRTLLRAKETMNADQTELETLIKEKAPMVSTEVATAIDKGVESQPGKRSTVTVKQEPNPSKSANSTPTQPKRSRSSSRSAPSSTTKKPQLALSSPQPGMLDDMSEDQNTVELSRSRRRSSSASLNTMDVEDDGDILDMHLDNSSAMRPIKSEPIEEANPRKRKADQIDNDEFVLPPPKKAKSTSSKQKTQPTSPPPIKVERTNNDTPQFPDDDLFETDTTTTQARSTTTTARRGSQSKDSTKKKSPAPSVSMKKELFDLTADDDDDAPPLRPVATPSLLKNTSTVDPTRWGAPRKK